MSKLSNRKRHKKNKVTINLTNPQSPQRLDEIIKTLETGNRNISVLSPQSSTRKDFAMTQIDSQKPFVVSFENVLTNKQLLQFEQLGAKGLMLH